MTETTQDDQCPCGSGLLFSECCGVPERRAINADIMASISSDGSITQGSVTPQIEQALKSISTLPDLFPARIRFADDKVYFVKMSPRWFSESVFLDPARMKGTYVIESNLQWTQAIADKIAWHPTNFIFHTAFCGSTLMTQALGAMYNSLPLREPEVLGNVLFYLRSKKNSDEQKKLWLARVIHLLSRSYDPQQYVVVKTNDFANPLIVDLAKWRSNLPILFMYTPLSEFLAGCLKADNRREWIRNRFNSVKSLAPKLLNKENPFSAEENAYGEMAAIYWSYNIALYHKAWQCSPQQIYSLEFNHMLAQPLESIEACGRLFGLQPQTGVDRKSEINKVFSVYSKNSDYKYSPQQRSDDVQRLLENNSEHLQIAEQLARELLQDDYPEKGLPGNLLD